MFVHQVFSLVAEAGNGPPRISSTWSNVSSICFAVAGCLRNHSSSGKYLRNSGCLLIDDSSNCSDEFDSIFARAPNGSRLHTTPRRLLCVARRARRAASPRVAVLGRIIFSLILIKPRFIAMLIAFQSVLNETQGRH